MILLADELGRAHRADLLAAAERQRLVARVSRARKASLRAERAERRAVRARRVATDAALSLS